MPARSLQTTGYGAPRRAAAGERAGSARFRPFLIALGMVALIAVAWSIEDPYFNYLLKLTAINVAVICGLNLLMGHAGQAFIAVAAIYAIGAYGSALAMLKLGFPFPVAWFAAALLAGLFGVISSIPALRLAGAYLAMVSIAFNVVVEEVIVHWDVLTGGPRGLSGIPGPGAGGWELSSQGVAALCVAVAALSWFLVQTLRRSPWGLALVAMRESEIVVKSLGVDTVRLKAAAFFVSGCIVGLGGGLYAHSITYISPDIGTIFASIVFVLMLILGGLGTAWGPVLGAVLLTVGPELLKDFQRYHLVVLGLLLLASIVLMPEGIVTALTRPLRRIRARKAEGEAETAASGQPTALGDLLAGRKAATALEIEGIRKHFGGIAALDGVELTIEPGTIHGLIGPNGSGKSTLVNVISGYYRADGGSARLEGREMLRSTMVRIAQSGVVRTFQTPQLFAGLSARENLQAGQFHRQAPDLASSLLGLRRSRRVSHETTLEAENIAAALGIAHLLDRPAGELALGDQRKLEIGRALAAQPVVLILDEPAAGLSTEESEGLCALLEELRLRGMTVLLIEHHMDVIMRVCDTITVLERGRVIARGAPAEIQTNEAVRAAYLGAEQAGEPIRI